MAGVNVNMGVSGIGQFKSAMSQAQQSVKTLDAQLKLNEKTFKKTGDSEAYLTQKTNLLKSQMAAQQNVIKNAENALKTMASQGVDKASVAYQKMTRQLAEAQGALMDMQTSMDGVGNEAQSAAGQADKMGDSLQSLNRKADLSILVNGIDQITSGLETAAQKAGELATKVWDTMVTAAGWADDTNTLASIYGLDVETLQQMQYASTIIDTPVDAIIKARQRLSNNMKYGSNDAMDAFKELGVAITELQTVTKTGDYGFINYGVQGFRNAEDVFWDVGAALMSMNDEVNRDAMANKLLGRSWQELRPIFAAGREEYEKTMGEAETSSADTVNSLNAFDDSLQKLQNRFDTLKNNALATLAPAFTLLADSLSGMMEEFNEYLQTDEGKAAMQGLSDAVTNLFEKLTNVDFGDAIEVAASALGKLTEGLEWISKNWSTVSTAIAGLAAAFAGLKVTSSMLNFLLIAKALGAGSAGAGAGAGAAAAGAGGAGAGAAGGAVAATVKSWITSAGAKILGGTAAGLAVLFENAFKPQGNDDIFTEEELAQYNRQHMMEIFLQRATFAKNKVSNRLQSMGEGFLADIQPIMDLESAQEQLNSATLTVRVTPVMWGNGSVWGSSGGAGGGGWTAMQRANGLAYVPYNGYPAILHKGERVLTAEANRSYTTNSNLYVENMTMNNGMDADALAGAIAARNSRIRAGYGG